MSNTWTSSSTKTLNILLVEDNDDHALIVSRNLSNDPHVNRIVRVEDGVEALEYLRNISGLENDSFPDMILLDLKLPRLDGHEVLAEIKADQELKRIPVIILTTSDADKDKTKAYELHANSYLVKPLQAADLKVMLKNMTYYWGQWNRMSPKRLRTSEEESCRR